MLELVIGILGLALSVVLFFVGDRRGRRTMQDSMRGVLTLAGQLPAGRAGPTGMLPDIDFPGAVGYTETGDVRRLQLLVMYGVGAHSMVLKIFDRESAGADVEEIARLFNGVGAAFEVRDFNGDGQPEIGTLEYDFDRAPERSFADACLQPVYYQWVADPRDPEAEYQEGLEPWQQPVRGRFREVARGETWDPLTGERQPNGRPPEHIDVFLRRPGWVISLPHVG